MSFTLEHVNSLLGSRQHRKASPYLTQGLAEEAARAEAKRVRPFVTINVLDARGRVVASFKGT
jgi:uncharacterized protein GlcG (DUF336 family)